MGEDFPARRFAAPRHFLGVDRHHDALVAEFFRRLLDEGAPVHRRGVDRDLVGAAGEQLADVVDRAHAAADRERHEAGFRRAPHHVVDGVAVLVAGGDVEEGELVGAGRVIGDGRFYRIAGVAQIDEIDALDHAAVFHVEAGNDADFEHDGLVFGQHSTGAQSVKLTSPGFPVGTGSMPDAWPDNPAYRFACLFAALLGFAAHRASICTVRAVAEMISARTAFMLASIGKSALWVIALTLPFLWLMPAAAAGIGGWQLTLTALAGGLVFGLWRRHQRRLRLFHHDAADGRRGPHGGVDRRFRRRHFHLLDTGRCQMADAAGQGAGLDRLGADICAAAVGAPAGLGGLRTAARFGAGVREICGSSTWSWRHNTGCRARRC